MGKAGKFSVIILPASQTVLFPVIHSIVITVQHSMPTQTANDIKKISQNFLDAPTEWQNDLAVVHCLAMWKTCSKLTLVSEIIAPPNVQSTPEMILSGLLKGCSA